MAQVSMDKITVNTANSAKVDKSADIKPAETPAQSAELIDNTSKKAEEPQKTEEEHKQEERREDKVVVRYVGSSIWKDSKGDLWAHIDKTKNILHERQYSKEEFDKREDIAFMVKYGEMQATYVG